MKNSSFPENQSRAESTIILYNRLYKSFERRIRQKERSPKDSLIKPAQVSMFFSENEGSWEKRTARLYRASIMFVLKERLLKGEEDITQAIEILTHAYDGEEEKIARKDALSRARTVLRARKARGPRQKVKRFSKEDTSKLIKALVLMRTDYGEKAAAWFVATALTGLRPSEWRTAYFDTHWDMTRTLVVFNAKATNGRSHGEKRTILLKSISNVQMRSIAAHMENVREVNSDDEFDIFYSNCRRCIQRVADKIWPTRKRHPTIYTARHMFAADVKSVFDKVGVAALMGHASIRTAGENYAKSWSGSGSVGVEPSEVDISSVTALNQIKILDDENKQQPGTNPVTNKKEWLATALTDNNQKSDQTKN